MTESRRILLGACALFVAVLAAYGPALHAGFIWDDQAHVTANRNLDDLAGLRAIWLDPGARTGAYAIQYYPVVHTVFWVARRLWGLNPVGYHLLNILLHALNAVLLWGVLRRLRVRGAFFAVVLFALHPVQVESVAWITELKNVLSGTFYFLAMGSYLDFAGCRERKGRYADALVFSVLALLSKSVTATLPAALLVILWWKDGRITRRDAWALLPFFALGAAAGLHTAWIEHARVGAQGPAWDLSWAGRVLVAGRALWFYAGKLILPVKLTFIYPRWAIDAAAPAAWVFPLSAAALVVTLWISRDRIGRGPLAAVLLFAGTLFPALGFLNVYPMQFSFVADHFQYLACAALFALFAAAVWRFPARAPLAAALAVGLGALGWHQAWIYRDLETLWRDTIAKNPACWMAHVNLGKLLSDRGDSAGAVEEYLRGLEIWPGDAGARNNLGLELLRAGQVDAAIAQFREAARLWPNYPDPLYHLGGALVRKGDAEGARAAFECAVLCRPDFTAARLELAAVLHRLGRDPEAIGHARESARRSPGDPVALNAAAWMLATRAGATDAEAREAVERAEEACRISERRHPGFLDTLAAAYAAAGDFERAAATAKEALALVGDAPAGRTLKTELESRLKLYAARRPYCEPAPAGKPAAPKR